MTRLRITLAVLAAATALAGAAGAQAGTVNRTGAATVSVDASLVTPVSGGCGPNGWRGAWGHCHYRGWAPGFVYAPPVYAPPVYVAPISNGCPPGFWRGPWGHCRNTPYHGRLPNGGWK